MNKRSPYLPIALLCILAVLAATVAGCAARPAPAPALERAVVATVGVEKAVASEARQPAAPPSPGKVPAVDLAMVQGEQRMLIRTAELSLSVQDTAEAAEKAKAIAEELGGYVADSQIYQQGERLYADMTLRVPAEEFNTALQRLKELAVDVKRETIHGEDVTEEYVDLQARLRNLELTEKELQQLLTEVRERTQDAEDVLAVYRELVEVRGQIEQIKGRMQYLERMVGFSTIRLNISPHALSEPVVEEGWEPLITLRNASRSLVKAFQWLVEAMIWVVVFLLPILALLAIPTAALVLFVRYLIRRRKGTD